MITAFICICAFVLGYSHENPVKEQNTHRRLAKVGADSGFPRGGAQTLRGAQTYYSTKFSQKVHENEEYQSGRGTRVQNFTM